MAMIQSFPTGSGNGTSKISQKLGNAATNITGSTNPTEDGLYVEDLSTIVNSISLSQKTVNSELEYFSAVGTQGSITLPTSTDYNFFPHLDIIKTNLDSSRYTTQYITLKAGKTYQLSFETLKSTDSAKGVSYHIVDSLGNKIGNRGYTGGGYGDSMVDVVYTPTSDVKINPMLVTKNQTSTSKYFPECSFFIVKEINRTITVDPVAYLSKDGNLEETPVGSIISYMGNNVPKHYLACDGSEYNINDYPELAIHIKESFGSFNYFGGDGVTTFAVPNLSGEFLRGTGTNSHANQGNGANVGEHQDATNMPNYWYDKYNVGMASNLNDTSTNHVTNVDSTIVPAGTKINYNDNSSSIFPSTLDHIWAFKFTTRPTNTSVLYCIKYETTHKIFFGDQTTYKVSVPITYNFPQTPQMVWAEFDRANAEDDISMLGSSLITSQGDAFVAPMDGYYHATFMFPEQADIPGTRVTYHSTYVYKNGIVIGGSDRQDNSTNIRVPLNESFTLKLKKGDTINVGMYMSGQTTAFTRNGQATFCLVNTLNENKVLELMNKPNKWVVGQEYDFGDGIYGVKLTLTNNSSSDATIDLSKYNVSEVEKIEGKAVVDGGAAQALIPCYYAPVAYLSCWFNFKNKVLHLSRGSQYQKSTDRFEINIWYKK